MVADPLEVGEDVGREDNRHAALRDRLERRLHELPPRERVERGDRLVEQQQLRPLRERQRQRDLRALPAGKIPHLLLQRQVELGDARASGLVVPAGVKAAADVEHLLDREAAVERVLLGEEADARESFGGVRVRIEPEYAHQTGARTRQAYRESQERCLARAVRPDERRHGAARDLERAVAERPLRAVALAEPLRLESSGHATLRTASSRFSERSASIACSSSPAARALLNQSRSERRSFETSSPSGDGPVLVTNVP